MQMCYVLRGTMTREAGSIGDTIYERGENNSECCSNNSKETP